ncbi:MAG: hypothetical protein U9R19_18775 [Bacteroidota bacterium]|nr:hypothetical protein [Bacteroidota bacterium]
MKTFASQKSMMILSIIFFLSLVSTNISTAQLTNWQEAITDNPCPGDSLGSIEISFIWTGNPPYSINWSNGETTEDIYSLSAGTYYLTISDSVPNVYLDTFTVDILNYILVSDSIIDASVLGSNNGEIYLSVLGGSGNYNISWAQGDTTANITNLYAGVYYVTISDTLTCANDVEETFYVNSPIPSGWEVTTTNTTQSIFLETSTCVKIGDSTLCNGSLIGVFHDEGGQSVCRGYTFWNHKETMITVFFHDSCANLPSYWQQEFEYKVYEPNSATSYSAQPCCFDYYYYSSICTTFGPASTNGQISCIYVENSYSQELSFYQGWNTFSVALDPYPANLEQIFAPIINNVKIIKDGAGLVYWPEYNVNFIGDVEVGKGYQIKTLSAQSLSVFGYFIYPELIPFIPPNGWSMFGYYSKTPSSPNAIFPNNPFITLPVEMIKDGMGYIWWPFYQLGYFELMPGIGYWIYVNYQDTYYFPAHDCN